MRPYWHCCLPTRPTLSLLTVSAAVWLALTSPAFGDGQPKTHRPTWSGVSAPPVRMTTPLSRMQPASPPAHDNRTHEKNPLRSIEPLIRPPAADPRIDPLLSMPAPSRSHTVFSTPRFVVTGESFTGPTPPDTIGEVGTTHFMQMVNSADGALFSLYDKTDGSFVNGPFRLSQLAPAGDLCASAPAGDGVVVFDQLVNRWLLLEFVDGSVGNRLCVYLSTGDDPLTSFWSFYGFSTDRFPDYPKVAVWGDTYGITTNEQNPGGTAQPSVYLLDRARMLADEPAGIVSFSVPPLAAFGFQTLTPADVDGRLAPAAGSPGILMRHRDDEAHNPPGQAGDILEIWESTVDFDTPANSSLVGPFEIAVAEFDSNLCGLAGASDACVPQFATAQGLDTIKQAIMWRLSYRNFETHETLLGNFTVDVDGNDVAGIRWFELRKAPGGDWGLHQEGTFGDSIDHRWLGSIAMDRLGNIALAFSTSSEKFLPNIAYTGQKAGSALGAMSEPQTLVIRSTWFQEGTSRWGDYSSMTVDPSDDLTFWFTTERILVVPIGLDFVGLWTTDITSFNFDRLLFADGFESGNVSAWQ